MTIDVEHSVIDFQRLAGDIGCSCKISLNDQKTIVDQFDACAGDDGKHIEPYLGK